MNLKYNWFKYPEVKELLNKIHKNSSYILKEDNCDINYADEFIEYIEDFLNYFITFKYDFDKILDTLKEIEFITLFDENDVEPDLSSLPTIRVNNRNHIYLNKNIEKDNHLTEKERTRLYLYQALSRKIFDFQNNETEDFSKLYSELYNDINYIKCPKWQSYQTECIVDYGWILLEDILSQVLAERITYFVLNKKQPGTTLGLDKIDVEMEQSYIITSDLEMYRMFHQILIYFGYSLSDIGSLKEHSKEKITYDLLNKAINGNFSCEVINEYKQRTNEFELYKSLYHMGLLLIEKYNVMGYRTIDTPRLNGTEIKELYTIIIKELAKLTTFKEETESLKKIKRKKLEPNDKRKITEFLKKETLFHIYK